MKVAIYCRLSEEDKNKEHKYDESASIQNQKSMLVEYAILNEWEIYKIYADDDFTGSDRNRPEFKQLLDDAEHKKFDIILCKTQSRFTRELELVEKYLHGLFPIWGVRFVSIVDNADTENLGNKKSRQINGLVNEWYLEDMSKNIKSVLTNRRINGLHIGAFALYGYKKDPSAKGHLIIDEQASEIVKEVFCLFTQGYGKMAIARILNERGIANPTEYKRSQGLRYKQPNNANSTLWRYSAIATMLSNEIYIGNMVQGKYHSISYKSKINKPVPEELWIKVENTHEPIIDKAVFKTVQEIISQKTKPHASGKLGIFSKKVKCSTCGYTLRSIKSRGEHYLQCATKFASKSSCEGSFISVSYLEKLILAKLKEFSAMLLDKDALLHSVNFSNDVTDKKAALIAEQQKCKKEFATKSEYLKTIYIDKLDGIITQNDYSAFSKDFTAQKEQHSKRITEIERKLTEMENQKQTEDTREKMINSYIDLQSLDYETVLLLIEYIEVSKRQKGQKHPKVVIHWNF